MGFEPTTASLEGWNSTTELRPPSFTLRRHQPHTATCYTSRYEPHCYKPVLVGRQGFEPWKT